MKEPQIEIVFIGIIILVFALWKISELIKTRCYERRQWREGFVAAAEAAAAAKKDVPRSETETFLSQIERLIPTKVQLSSNGGGGGVLSTENFTVDTTENEMTVHQRKKIAPVAPVAPVSAPPPSTVKEGLENPDANTKEFIDKNITSINPQDSQSRFKLRDYYIKSAYNAFNPDKFKNSTVSMDAGLYTLARGCRFIDFEVFSVDNQPVIASSSVNSFNYKETFYVKVLDKIGKYLLN